MIKSAFILFIMCCLGGSLIADSAQARHLYNYKDKNGIFHFSENMPNRCTRSNTYHYSNDLTIIHSCLPYSNLQAQQTVWPTYAARQIGRRFRRRYRHYYHSKKIDALVSKTASEIGLDRALLLAVITVESNFNPHARSSAGAIGLMQVMPATAKKMIGLAANKNSLANPTINLNVGSRHLRRLIERYPGHLELAIAAYNAGEGAVNKYDGVPPYSETQRYVRNVLEMYDWYRMES